MFRRRLLAFYLTRKLGHVLLGVWLTVMGLMQVFELTFRYSGLVMGMLAIAAGICILLDR